jgi:hypothetical protein
MYGVRRSAQGIQQIVRHVALSVGRREKAVQRQTLAGLEAGNALLHFRFPSDAKLYRPEP